MCRKFKKLTKFKKILFLTALVLLLFFAVHAVEFNHEHAYEIFGSDKVKAVLHAGDKKLWLFLILAAMTFIFTSFTKAGRSELIGNRGRVFSFSALYLFFYLFKLFDPLRAAFRRGILNSKICE